MTTVAPVTFAHPLTLDVVTEVLAVLDAATAADGVFPLSEHVLLHLRNGGDPPAVHLLARAADGHLTGYAHLDPTDPTEGTAVELAVHPAARRRGLGRALVRAAMAVADERTGGRLRLWAHGDHPSARALAASLGFERYRVLLQMRRPLGEPPLPEPVLPAGVRLRAFVPGVDDEAWVRLNARAFAEHPEQGRWTVDDLRVRLAEPWFDPAGFLLAQREADGALVGFHWTKVHGNVPGGAVPGGVVSDGAVPGGVAPDGAAPGVDHGHGPIGEVYVLGVDPAAHGGGLGRALTLAGLRHLRDRGLEQAMLYVDESNTGAVALYRALRFMPWSTDVAYRLR